MFLYFKNVKKINKFFEFLKLIEIIWVYRFVNIMLNID